MGEDTALLALEVGTLWDLDERGRLLRAGGSGHGEAPLVAVAAPVAGGSTVWRCSARVSDDVASTVASLVPDHSRPARLGWVPDSGDDLLAALGPRGPVRIERGPSYVLDQPAPGSRGDRWTSEDSDAGAGLASDVALRTSDAAGAEAVLGRLPVDDADLVEPWAVVLVGDEVAAVCETARSTRGSVEAGVWTYERHRRRGYGHAAVAAWTTLVEDRCRFYSTSLDNVGSQALARRLGARPLGQWWQVHGAGS